MSDLSPKELEVLKWLTKGYKNQEIASVMGIQYGAVRKYNESIFRKLGVENRTQAMLVGYKHGLYDN